MLINKVKFWFHVKTQTLALNQLGLWVLCMVRTDFQNNKTIRTVYLYNDMYTVFLVLF